MNETNKGIFKAQKSRKTTLIYYFCILLNAQIDVTISHIKKALSNKCKDIYIWRDLIERASKWTFSIFKVPLISRYKSQIWYQNGFVKV